MGESMLVDLRDRILGQGGIPALPEGWYAESALKSAGGTPFAGDFIVATRPRSVDRLEVVVVDVSGKGEEAGTRALQLSGACAGLLTALPPARFLPAANDYLLRQEWEEGFATAIHLSLDLTTGEFQVRTAGHPPAVQLFAGSGRWSVIETEGPVLGLIDDAEFPSVEGVIRPGDALLLYTDGMVETRRRDIGARDRPPARPGRAAAARQLRRRGDPTGRHARAERRPGAAGGPPALTAAPGVSAVSGGRGPRLGRGRRRVAR